VVVLVVGIASFVAMGLAMSTLIPNQEAAGPVTSIVFFVLLFLSGLWFPLRRNSGLAKIATYFPIHHLISAVFAPFEFQPGVSPWAWHDLLIVAIWGAASAVVALRRFQWAPRRS
jgi:ABC-2 type transport system permease protein